MHLVIDNVTDLSEIDRVDDFIIPILFVAIKIFGLTSMACFPLAGKFETE
jgi:hypothetical protein